MSRRDYHGTCASCDTALLNARGYAGTDLCGPCCTGEADSATDVCAECDVHGWHVLDGKGRCPQCVVAATKTHGPWKVKA